MNHSKTLSPSAWTPPDALRALLIHTLSTQHQGRDKGIHVDELVAKTSISARTLRKLVSDARMEGIAICGKPESGYFIAQTAEELDETLDFLRARWLRGASVEARMRKTSLPALLGQMNLKD
jgi:predicted DNA-binding transcriptional regulator YafY